MKLFVKYDVNVMCRQILEEQLTKSGIKHNILGIGEVDLKEEMTDDQRKQLLAGLRKYGFELVENPKDALVQKIKDTVIEMVTKEDNFPNEKISYYLAEKLNHSYSYISNTFSEVTYTSVESYIIMQKIERAKQMIISGEHTLTEISFKLNYSSVAHLSAQFKKTTGLTPSAFQRIITKRRTVQAAEAN